MQGGTEKSICAGAGRKQRKGEVQIFGGGRRNWNGVPCASERVAWPSIGKMQVGSGVNWCCRSGRKRTAGTTRRSETVSRWAKFPDCVGSSRWVGAEAVARSAHSAVARRVTATMVRVCRMQECRRHLACTDRPDSMGDAGSTSSVSVDYADNTGGFATRRGQSNRCSGRLGQRRFNRIDQVVDRTGLGDVTVAIGGAADIIFLVLQLDR